ncbi:putative capsular polysaccharide synthesis family protein [soil metagenome]
MKKIFFKLFNRKEFKILNNFIFNAYTMGKVGSVTIEKTIAKRVFYNKIFHLHFLSKEGLEKHKAFNKTEQGYSDAREFEVVRKNNPQKRVKIITLVRDPLARDISDLFQNFRVYMSVQQIKEVNVEQLLNRFKGFDHEYALQWFDDEFRNYLGVDIYGFEFNKKKGYQIIENLNCDVLIIRLENLTSVFSDAMQAFTGIGGWILSSEENSAENKAYSELYESFKKKVVIGKDVLDLLYNSKYYNHFYTQEEKAKSISKWARTEMKSNPEKS